MSCSKESIEREERELREWAEKKGIPWEQVKPVPLAERMEMQNQMLIRQLRGEEKK